MKIGIVSDTHGRMDRLETAIRTFTDRGVDAVVHCGDMAAEDGMRCLASAGVPAYAVAGNMDRDVDRLKAAAAREGVNFAGEVIRIPLEAGRCIVAVHGHDEAILEELVAEQQFPYVCTGHTHEPVDEKVGGVRVINPGALFHPRGPHKPTVAVLDTDADTVEFVDL